MKHRSWAALLLGAWASLPGEAHACAGCRNPNMPVTRLEASALRAGELRTALSLGATGVQVSHEAGCADLSDCDEQPPQSLYIHDQGIFPGELRLLGEYGVTAAWGVELQLPVRIVRTTIEYATPAGQPYQPLDAGNHHRDETLLGVGDPWLLGRWAGAVGKTLIAFKAGVALPLGRTEPNPFVLGARGEKHQHIQFGSGTFDPVFALDVSRPAGLWMLSTYAQGQAGLYENEHGLQAGSRISGGLQAGRKVWGAVTGSLGLEAAYEGPERWDGEILQEGNLGRTEVLTALSLIQAFRTAALGLSVRVPVYRHIVTGDEPAGDYSSPVMVSLFAGKIFRL